MELVHDFTVPVSRRTGLAVLTDVERIAPCLPGAAVRPSTVTPSKAG